MTQAAVTRHGCFRAADSKEARDDSPLVVAGIFQATLGWRKRNQWYWQNSSTPRINAGIAPRSFIGM